MHILIDADNSNSGNMGDIAMLQVAVERLRLLWPNANLHVITGNAEALTSHCPDVTTLHELSRYTWLADDYLLGRFHKHLSPWLAHQFSRSRRAARRYAPHSTQALIRGKTRWRGHPHGDPQAFLDAVANTDLFVVCGLGGMTDTARAYSLLVLDTIELALQQNKPVAMFSQGIGPVTDVELRTRMAAILPHIQLVALRERRAGPLLLESLGVDRARIHITGDDAVELAYRNRIEQPGEAIGINLRVAPYAGIDDQVVSWLRPLVQRIAHTRGVPMVPIPITRHRHAQDALVIQQMLRGYMKDTDGGIHLDTPLKVIQQVGRCRVVITGAYHAAVFALAQGIPAICLCQSDYYRDKFRGLADVFGAGCEIVFLNDSDKQERLIEAVERMWQSAKQLRPSLLLAATTQIAWGHAAYQCLPKVTGL